MPAPIKTENVTWHQSISLQFGFTGLVPHITTRRRGIVTQVIHMPRAWPNNGLRQAVLRSLRYGGPAAEEGLNGCLSKHM
jgi:hypothetical protein